MNARQGALAAPALRRGGAPGSCCIAGSVLASACGSGWSARPAPPFRPTLPLFVSIGLADSNFNAKPALASWDSLFARVRVA